MSLADSSLAILGENIYLDVIQSQKGFKSPNISANLRAVNSAKGPFNSRSSDSGKSSSGSPILLDCSFDSGIAGVLEDGKDMQLHKRIQQCQCILLALARDQEYFLTVRNRLSKISNRKQKQCNENEYFCNVCCAEIDANDENTYVKCHICKKYICRSVKCSDWLPNSDERECELCQTSKESLAQTSSWVADQITFNQDKFSSHPRARSEVYIPISEYNDSFIHFESVSQVGVNSVAITAEQKFKIREFVEEVVSKLLGGNLDTVSVNQMSKSENYLNLFHKYHSKLSNMLINLENVLASNKDDLPDPKDKNIRNGTSQETVGVSAEGNDFSNISETRLRQMIQKIIAETMSLPPLTNGHAVSQIALERPSRTSATNNGFFQRHRTEHYFEPAIYQDLLATAVLNKIVDKQQNNNQSVPVRDTGDGQVGDGSDDHVNSNRRFPDSDRNANVENASISSGSSVEPPSDCSYPDFEQLLNNNDDKSKLVRNSDRDSVMSEYLANHMIPLPDLNAVPTESDEDDYTSVTSSAIGEGTWEQNWLFRKKKSALSGSVPPNSVGMLVPDPKEDVRAQIGDKTADEVSDLSELGSDSDNSLNSLHSQLDPINDRLVNKHIIGGQNSKMILDEIIERSSMISSTIPSDGEAVYADACNEHIIVVTTKIDAETEAEDINANINQQQSSIGQEVEESKESLNTVGPEDPLMASGDRSESDGCTGFSAVEIIESTSCTPPSVVEILAAMALGPMLAVPSLDQPVPMTVSDINTLAELKALALAEIKTRAFEIMPHNLDIIPEESGDVTNQTERNSTHGESECQLQSLQQLTEPEISTRINSKDELPRQIIIIDHELTTDNPKVQTNLNESIDFNAHSTKLILDKLNLDIENLENENNSAVQLQSPTDNLHSNTQLEIISKEQASDLNSEFLNNQIEPKLKTKDFIEVISKDESPDIQSKQSDDISKDPSSNVELQRICGSSESSNYIRQINTGDNISTEELKEQHQEVSKQENAETSSQQNKIVPSEQSLKISAQAILISDETLFKKEQCETVSNEIELEDGSNNTKDLVQVSGIKSIEESAKIPPEIYGIIPEKEEFVIKHQEVSTAFNNEVVQETSDDEGLKISLEQSLDEKEVTHKIIEEQTEKRIVVSNEHTDSINKSIYEQTKTEKNILNKEHSKEFEENALKERSPEAGEKIRNKHLSETKTEQVENNCNNQSTPLNLTDVFGATDNAVSAKSTTVHNTVEEPMGKINEIISNEQPAEADIEQVETIFTDQSAKSNVEEAQAISINEVNEHPNSIISTIQEDLERVSQIISEEQHSETEIKQIAINYNVQSTQLNIHSSNNTVQEQTKAIDNIIEPSIETLKDIKIISSEQSVEFRVKNALTSSSNTSKEQPKSITDTIEQLDETISNQQPLQIQLKQLELAEFSLTDVPGSSKKPVSEPPENIDDTTEENLGRRYAITSKEKPSGIQTHRIENICNNESTEFNLNDTEQIKCVNSRIERTDERPSGILTEQNTDKTICNEQSAEQNLMTNITVDEQFKTVSNSPKEILKKAGEVNSMEQRTETPPKQIETTYAEQLSQPNLLLEVQCCSNSIVTVESTSEDNKIKKLLERIDETINSNEVPTETTEQTEITYTENLAEPSVEKETTNKDLKSAEEHIEIQYHTISKEHNSKTSEIICNEQSSDLHLNDILSERRKSVKNTEEKQYTATAVAQTDFVCTGPTDEPSSVNQVADEQREEYLEKIDNIISKEELSVNPADQIETPTETSIENDTASNVQSTEFFLQKDLDSSNNARSEQPTKSVDNIIREHLLNSEEITPKDQCYETRTEQLKNFCSVQSTELNLPDLSGSTNNSANELSKNPDNAKEEPMEKIDKIISKDQTTEISTQQIEILSNEQSNKRNLRGVLDFTNNTGSEHSKPVQNGVEEYIKSIDTTISRVSSSEKPSELKLNFSNSAANEESKSTDNAIKDHLESSDEVVSKLFNESNEQVENICSEQPTESSLTGILVSANNTVGEQSKPIRSINTTISKGQTSEKPKEHLTELNLTDTLGSTSNAVVKLSKTVDNAVEQLIEKLDEIIMNDQPTEQIANSAERSLEDAEDSSNYKERKQPKFVEKGIAENLGRLDEKLSKEQFLEADEVTSNEQLTELNLTDVLGSTIDTVSEQSKSLDNAVEYLVEKIDEIVLNDQPSKTPMKQIETNFTEHSPEPITENLQNSSSSPEKDQRTFVENSIAEQLDRIDETVCGEQPSDALKKQLEITSTAQSTALNLKDNLVPTNNTVGEQSKYVGDVIEETLGRFDEAISREQHSETLCKQIVIISSETSAVFNLTDNLSSTKCKVGDQSKSIGDAAEDPMKKLNEMIADDQSYETRMEPVETSCTEQSPEPIIENLQNSSSRPENGQPTFVENSITEQLDRIDQTICEEQPSKALREQQQSISNVQLTEPLLEDILDSTNNTVGEQSKTVGNTAEDTTEKPYKNFANDQPTETPTQKIDSTSVKEPAGSEEKDLQDSSNNAENEQSEFVVNSTPDHLERLEEIIPKEQNFETVTEQFQISSKIQSTELSITASVNSTQDIVDEQVQTKNKSIEDLLEELSLGEVTAAPNEKIKSNFAEKLAEPNVSDVQDFSNNAISEEAKYVSNAIEETVGRLDEEISGEQHSETLCKQIEIISSETSAVFNLTDNLSSTKSKVDDQSKSIGDAAKDLMEKLDEMIADDQPSETPMKQIETSYTEQSPEPIIENLQNSSSRPENGQPTFVENSITEQLDRIDETICEEQPSNALREQQQSTSTVQSAEPKLDDILDSTNNIVGEQSKFLGNAAEDTTEKLFENIAKDQPTETPTQKIDSTSVKELAGSEENDLQDSSNNAENEQSEFVVTSTPDHLERLEEIIPKEQNFETVTKQFQISSKIQSTELSITAIVNSTHDTVDEQVQTKDKSIEDPLEELSLSEVTEAPNEKIKSTFAEKLAEPNVSDVQDSSNNAISEEAKYVSNAIEKTVGRLDEEISGEQHSETLCKQIEIISSETSAVFNLTDNLSSTKSKVDDQSKSIGDAAKDLMEKLDEMIADDQPSETPMKQIETSYTEQSPEPIIENLQNSSSRPENGQPTFVENSITEQLDRIDETICEEQPSNALREQQQSTSTVQSAEPKLDDILDSTNNIVGEQSKFLGNAAEDTTEKLFENIAKDQPTETPTQKIDSTSVKELAGSEENDLQDSSNNAENEQSEFVVTSTPDHLERLEEIIPKEQNFETVTKQFQISSKIQSTELSITAIVNSTHDTVDEQVQTKDKSIEDPLEELSLSEVTEAPNEKIKSTFAEKLAEPNVSDVQDSSNNAISEEAKYVSNAIEETVGRLDEEISGEQHSETLCKQIEIISSETSADINLTDSLTSTKSAIDPREKLDEMIANGQLTETSIEQIETNCSEQSPEPIIENLQNVSSSPENDQRKFVENAIAEQLDRIDETVCGEQPSDVLKEQLEITFAAQSTEPKLEDILDSTNNTVGEQSKTMGNTAEDTTEKLYGNITNDQPTETSTKKIESTNIKELVESEKKDLQDSSNNSENEQPEFVVNVTPDRLERLEQIIHIEQNFETMTKEFQISPNIQSTEVSLTAIVDSKHDTIDEQVQTKDKSTEDPMEELSFCQVTKAPNEKIKSTFTEKLAESNVSDVQDSSNNAISEEAKYVGNAIEETVGRLDEEISGEQHSETLCEQFESISSETSADIKLTDSLSSKKSIVGEQSKSVGHVAEDPMEKLNEMIVNDQPTETPMEQIETVCIKEPAELSVEHVEEYEQPKFKENMNVEHFEPPEQAVSRETSTKQYEAISNEQSFSASGTVMYSGTEFKIVDNSTKESVGKLNEIILIDVPTEQIETTCTEVSAEPSAYDVQDSLSNAAKEQPKFVEIAIAEKLERFDKETSKKQSSEILAEKFGIASHIQSVKPNLTDKLGSANKNVCKKSKTFSEDPMEKFGEVISNNQPAEQIRSICTEKSAESSIDEHQDSSKSTENERTKFVENMISKELPPETLTEQTEIISNELSSELNLTDISCSKKDEQIESMGTEEIAEPSFADTQSCSSNAEYDQDNAISEQSERIDKTLSKEQFEINSNDQLKELSIIDISVSTNNVFSEQSKSLDRDPEESMEKLGTITQGEATYTKQLGSTMEIQDSFNNGENEQPNVAGTLIKREIISNEEDSEKPAEPLEIICSDQPPKTATEKIETISNVLTEFKLNNISDSSNNVTNGQPESENNIIKNHLESFNECKALLSETPTERVIIFEQSETVNNSIDKPMGKINETISNEQPTKVEIEKIEKKFYEQSAESNVKEIPNISSNEANEQPNPIDSIREENLERLPEIICEELHSDNAADEQTTAADNVNEQSIETCSEIISKEKFFETESEEINIISSEHLAELSTIALLPNASSEQSKSIIMCQKHPNEVIKSCCNEQSTEGKLMDVLYSKNNTFAEQLENTASRTEEDLRKIEDIVLKEQHFEVTEETEQIEIVNNELKSAEGDVKDDLSPTNNTFCTQRKATDISAKEELGRLNEIIPKEYSPATLTEQIGSEQSTGFSLRDALESTKITGDQPKTIANDTEECFARLGEIISKQSSEIQNEKSDIVFNVKPAEPNQSRVLDSSNDINSEQAANMENIGFLNAIISQEHSSESQNDQVDSICNKQLTELPAEDTADSPKNEKSKTVENAIEEDLGCLNEQPERPVKQVDIDGNEPSIDNRLMPTLEGETISKPQPGETPHEQIETNCTEHSSEPILTGVAGFTKNRVGAECESKDNTTEEHMENEHKQPTRTCTEIIERNLNIVQDFSQDTATEQSKSGGNGLKEHLEYLDKIISEAQPSGATEEGGQSTEPSLTDVLKFTNTDIDDQCKISENPVGKLDETFSNKKPNKTPSEHVDDICTEQSIDNNLMPVLECSTSGVKLKSKSIEDLVGKLDEIISNEKPSELIECNLNNVQDSSQNTPTEEPKEESHNIYKETLDGITSEVKSSEMTARRIEIISDTQLTKPSLNNISISTDHAAREVLKTTDKTIEGYLRTKDKIICLEQSSEIQIKYYDFICDKQLAENMDVIDSPIDEVNEQPKTMDVSLVDRSEEIEKICSESDEIISTKKNTDQTYTTQAEQLSDYSKSASSDASETKDNISSESPFETQMAESEKSSSVVSYPANNAAGKLVSQSEGNTSDELSKEMYDTNSNERASITLTTISVEECKTEYNSLEEQSSEVLNKINTVTTSECLSANKVLTEISTAKISAHDGTLQSSNQMDILEHHFIPKSKILTETNLNSSLCVESVAAEQTSLEEDESSMEGTFDVTRQSTVVEVENSSNHMQLLESVTSTLPGNLNISKKLQRQCRVVDTTPSFEDVSPLPMPQTSPPSHSNTLANLCQKFIHDKHLLTALENRRRRTLLMHRFLSTLDLSHSADDSMEETHKIHTEVVVLENPIAYKSLIHSCDYASDHDDCSDLHILQINELDTRKISYNFINTILFSDQLSYDSNPYAGSRTSTVEELIDNDNDENNSLAINFNNNKSITNTTLIANANTTNTSPDTSCKAITNATKNYNHKQSITNVNGSITAIPPKQSHPENNVLNVTSALQDKDAHLESTQHIRGELIDSGQSKVMVYKDGKEYHNIYVGDHNDGDSDDDVMAIFRHFVPGSIAEREYKKWYNAVEMPNNPYAPEALMRRISSGSQERFIDLPNISPTKDLNPLDLLNESKLDADENMMPESDYKRYSRDYYINSTLITSQTSSARDVSGPVTKDVREVNNHYNNINKNNSYQNKSRNANTTHFPNDCHRTLSTPVRRSSSLKYLNHINNSNNSPHPSHLQDPTCHRRHYPTHFTTSNLPTRPSTSISYYNRFDNSINNDGTEDGEDNTSIDLNSKQSWKNSYLAPNSKCKTVSMLSLLSADSSRSGGMSRSKYVDNDILTQFEKQLLHKDLKRNSFRDISATTKEFALNPLYEKDQVERALPYLNQHEN